MADGPIIARSENGVIRDHLDDVIAVIQEKIDSYEDIKHTATDYKVRRRYRDRVTNEKRALRSAQELRAKYARD